MVKIRIGYVTGAVGLKGEIKVYSYLENTKLFQSLERIFIDGQEVKIENVRYKGKIVILKVSNISDRDTAERQKDRNVYIWEDQTEKLPEGTYYVRDILGFSVFDTEDNQLGVLRDVTGSGAQDILNIIDKEGKNIMIPAVPEFLISADMKEKKIIVRLIEGMI
ncbi:MAG: ribosome maturation factor RimM [Eubacteriales bacterium]|nr:ribosome maturation factor RimM [Eubacteriales bacterium]NLF47805.1 16S rRNA processing protein RimM [Clostridiales bacterium]